MSKSVRVAIALSLLFTLAVTVGQHDSRAQEEGASFPGLPAPTEAHQELAKDVGKWDAVVKFWMSPDTPPQQSEATEVNQAMGGFWIVSDFQGSFAGVPFQGHGLFGYDPVNKKYVGTWIDSMSPHMMTMEGNVDKATGKLVMIGKGIDAATGQEMQSKNISWTNEDGTRTFEMYHPVEGKEDEWWKIMEIVYTKAEAGDDLFGE